MNRSFYEKIAKLLLKGYKKKIIHLHEPTFEITDFHYLKKCLKQGIVSSTGNAIIRNNFESEILKYTKSKFALATINGVSALHICLKTLKVGKNHEVLVPSKSKYPSALSNLYLRKLPLTGWKLGSESTLFNIAYFNFLPFRGRYNKYPTTQSDMNFIIPNSINKFVKLSRKIRITKQYFFSEYYRYF